MATQMPNDTFDLVSAGSGNTAPLTSSGGSEFEKPPTKKRQPKEPQGSYINRIPGRRTVKEYPLTEADMRDIAKTGVIAAGSFSMATGLFGFVVNLSKDMAFSSSVSDKVLGFWNGVWWACVIAIPVLLAIAGWAIWDGNARIQKIKDETTHKEQA